MNNDARRILATLVRITQLDTSTTHQRGLMFCYAILENLGQSACLEFAHRIGIGMLDMFEKDADTASMQCRDIVPAGKVEECQLALEVFPDSCALLLREPVPLVDDDDKGPATFDQVAREMRILLGHTLLCVEQQQAHIGLLDRLQRFHDAEFLDRFPDTAALANTGSIDQGEALAVEFVWHRDAITCRARHVKGDNTLLADQPVDERRLANIGSANDGDPDTLLFILFGRYVRRWQGLENAVDELAHTTPVCCGDGDGFAGKTIEFGDGHCRIEAFALVDDQRDWLAGAPQSFGNGFIAGITAITGIDEKEHMIGLINCLPDLLFHERIDALLLPAETAGINDDIGEGTDAANAVLAVARQPRQVCNECVARTRQTVEERRFTDIGTPDEGDDGQHRKR